MAKGKFPLSGKKDDDDDEDSDGDHATPRQKKRSPDDALMASNGVIGGAAGYWAMIKVHHLHLNCL